MSRTLVGDVLDRSLQLRVLDCDTSCAYGWPDGRIYLTRSLVDLLDDDELAAAIAHELGHLILHGHLPGVAALRGCQRRDGDAENRADEAGIWMLQTHGLRAAAMSSMLAKVASAPGTPADCRHALLVRIQRLAGEDDRRL